MAKKTARIVLTGGPAAGKTTLMRRVADELGEKEGWRIITIPETATELIGGFGIGPFEGCMDMEQFQRFVIPDQLHKEKLALRAADTVLQEKVLILYDRAVFDDKAYVTDEQFVNILTELGYTEEEILGHYDAVIHLSTCARSDTVDAYTHENSIRYEDAEGAVRMDELVLRAWSAHPNRRVIANVPDFEEKMQTALDALRELALECFDK